MKQLIHTLILTYRHHKEIILYLFFGVCTTLINIVCYALLYDMLRMSNFISTVIAWFVAVVFAFLTNKIFVFESKSPTLDAWFHEMISFFGCRFLTGILDVAIMVVAVDWLHWNGVLWKLISNVIVTVLNYVASKCLIFKDTQ